MNKKIKRYLAGLLAFTFVSSSLTHNVFSDAQTPVTGHSIELTGSNQDNNAYKLKFSWPTVYANNGTSNNLREVGVQYSISGKNETKAAPELPTVGNPDLIFQSSTKSQTFSQDYILESGSFYSFKIKAAHTNTILKPDPNNPGGFLPEDIGVSAESKPMLFLTRPTATAFGENGAFTLTWDSPTFNGSTVPWYQIQITKPIKYDPIMVETSQLAKEGGKVSYTFSPPNVIPGKEYEFVVEPFYDKTTPMRSRSSVTFEQETYAFTMYGNPVTIGGVFMKPWLKVTQDGADFVRLEWSKMSDPDPIRVEIRSDNSPDGEFQNILATLIDAGARDVTAQSFPNPGKKTYYKLIFYFAGNKSTESDIEFFDPTLIDFTPYIPKFYHELFKDNAQKPLSISVSWFAFARKAYNSDEVTDDRFGKHIDKNIAYEVWITDNLADLDNPNLPRMAIIDANELDAWDYLGEPAYTSKDGTFVRYATRTIVDGKETGDFEVRNITDNKVYYFMIRAKRTDTGDKDIYSKVSHGSYYIPPLGDIPLEPQVLAKPPLRIWIDDNGNQVITETTVGVEWDTKWFEAYNDADQTWSAVVSVTSQGALVFREPIPEDKGHVNLYDRKYQEKGIAEGKIMIQSELAALGINPPPAIRHIDLKDAGYECHVVDYDYISKYVKDPLSPNPYSNYITDLMKFKNPGSEDIWQDITPIGDPNTSLRYLIEELEENTGYVIFIRSYVSVKDDDGVERRIYSYYPSYVTATTLDTKKPVIPTPVIPTLIGVGTTDTTLTVKWEFLDELNYELVISDDVKKLVEGGTSLKHADLIKLVEFKTENNKRFAYLTFTDLFPDTIYYLAIRSVAPAAPDKPSAWSNPINLKTTDIAPPSPPRGLGLVSNSDLNKYNKENDTKFKTIGPYNIILQWMRIAKDTGEMTFEVNGENAEVLEIPGVDDSYVLLLNELEPNKTYYFRAKTVLTLTREGLGSKATYNYIIQMADNEDFEDALEFEVPPLEELESEVNQKRKESDWTPTVYFKTGTTTDDFDTDKNPAQYPLPDTDFEITYDPKSDTLTFRFKTNGSDKLGANDNLVDQRFISRMLSQKAFSYKVDMTFYEGRRPQNRVLDMPYSIIKAFEERKMDLHIVAGEMDYTLTAQALQTFTSTPGFSQSSKIKIAFSKTNPVGIEPLEYFVTEPQTIKIDMVTNGRPTEVTRLNSPAKVSLPMVTHENNDFFGVYYSDGNSGGWKYVPSNFVDVDRRLNFDSATPSTYSVIAKRAQEVQHTKPEQDESFRRFTSRIRIKDLDGYDPDERIIANQINNLMIAVAKGKPEATIDTPMSSTDYNDLVKAQLLLTGIDVSREKGIAALVRLYEIKTKSSVSQYPSLKDTFHIDIGNAKPEYRDSLLKASYLGFFGEDTARPSDNLTLGEAFYILDIILQDAN